MCHAKAVGAGVPVDPRSEAAGLAKVQPSFVKAEGRGDRIITGEEPEAASATQSRVIDVGSILEKQVFWCQGGGCRLYATDFVDCLTRGGTLGALGTVCDGHGMRWRQGRLDDVGFLRGTFTPNSVRLPSGSCAR